MVDRRRRRHVAASARILTAGLSSAAALGMIADMAVSGATGNQPEATLSQPAADAPPAPSEGAVVIRRHWIAGTAPLPAPTRAPAPARSVQAARPAAPAPRPVTRSRGS